METFTILSIGVAAVLGVIAGVMLVELASGVRTPAPSQKRPPQRHRA
jgi:hypothetical protein